MDDRILPPLIGCRSASLATSLLTSIVGVGLLSQAAVGADFLVSSAAQIATAMQSAQPGDSLIMTDGVWTDQHIQFAGDGMAGAPITLRAQTPGGVTLNGSSRLSISGDWLVADGLNFSGGALASGNVVEFRGSNGEATNSRFTNSAIVDYNPASIDTRYFWVSLYGQSNRVDHNYFSGQSHSGVTVTVWRDSSAADNHLIDNNLFADRPEGNGNGFETIRIGDSSESLSDSFTTVQNNLFEEVDGEIEIISNKSGSNSFLYNTFRRSSGTLTLRHGDNNLVAGNFFLGEGKDGSGGVRVIGENQTLVNNYFHDLDGRAGGAISISAGVSNSELNEYYQVKNAMIAHNTIVDVNEAAIKLDDGIGSSGRTLRAENVTIANNLINSTQDTLFQGTAGVGWTWEGNLAFGQSLGSQAGNPGITVANPMLAMGTDGLFRIAADSPARDMAVSGYSALAMDDMDGQARDNMPDIGADEYSFAAIVRVPLTAEDVGPDWLGDNPPPPTFSGCGLPGCAIQAEDFATILDPDGDGNKWTVESAVGALGGQVIKAPDGDRVDLPAELHDTIATYELEFATAGVYTAYYRARGFDGSSDSIYTPDGFGTNPDNNESLSSNGQFTWEKDSQTFTITGGNTGVPLEFRLGMREQDAEIDAFVLHLDDSLTDAELDALFTLLDGDYNNDGVVDAVDYAVWRESLGQSGGGLPSDGDGSGGVDSADFEMWRENYGATRAGLLANLQAAQVPEPASLIPSCLGLLALANGARVYRNK